MTALDHVWTHVGLCRLVRPNEQPDVQLERAYLSDVAKRLHRRLLILNRAATRAREDRRRKSVSRRLSSPVRRSSVMPLPATAPAHTLPPQNAVVRSGTLLHGLMQLHGAVGPRDTEPLRGTAHSAKLSHVVTETGGSPDPQADPPPRPSVIRQRSGDALRRLAQDKARLIQIAQRFIGIDAGLRRQLTSREGSRSGRERSTRSALSLQRVGAAISKRFQQSKVPDLRVEGAPRFDGDCGMW